MILLKKFFNLNPFIHLIISLLIHIILILFCEIQDRYLDVKYTDIDYVVFTDGSRHILNGTTPFDRPTYRYTPFLAYLMIPNIIWFEQFGKLLFTLFDLIGGLLIYGITLTKTKNDNRQQYLNYYLLWLYNPLTLIISTRGSSESLICTLVLLVIFLFIRNHLILAGLCFGFVIHFKIYPIIYASTFYLYLTENNSSILNSNFPKIKFGISTLIGLSIPTYLSYKLCGWIYIEEAWLYHFYRQDLQHNFSPYFYFYQLFDDTTVRKIIGFTAFIPQMLLATIIVPIYYNQSAKTMKSALCMSLFIQTYTFVILNKVITAQYFEWYICLLPIIVPYLRLSLKKWFVIFSIWSTSILQWLLCAYLYEFRHWNNLHWLGIASVMFVLMNISLIIVLHSNFFDINVNVVKNKFKRK